MSKPRLLLVDGNSLLHRAYHALPPLMSSAGVPTNAVYGLAQMLVSLLEQQPPEAALVAFDAPGPTFRHQEYPQYKATRKPTPDDLVPQFGLGRQLVEALGLAQAELGGYEADDLIAALARQAAEQGYEVLVVTGDRDLVQLVDDDIHVLATIRGVGETRLYDRQQVAAEYGLEPEQLPDFKGLAGDSSDNLPGVAGIGKKTATSLLQEYGSLEAILEKVDSISSPRARKALASHEQEARLSKRLAQLGAEEVPLQFDAEKCRWEGFDHENLRDLLLTLEFSKLLQRLEKEMPPPAGTEEVEQATLEVLLSAAAQQGGLYLAGAWHDEILVGLGLGEPGGQVTYTPVGEGKGEQDLFSESAQPQLSADLAQALADQSLGKHGPKLKQLDRFLRTIGLSLGAYHFDAVVADYVLAPHRRDHSMDKLISLYLGEPLPPLSEYEGRALVEVSLLPALEEKLRERLKETNLELLFTRVEMPLARVLAEMETVGVAVDATALERLDEIFAAQLESLAQRILALAECEFNPDSPQQVGKVLFEQMELPGGRRTKTGWSTSAAVLEDLAEEHEIVRLVLEYREYAKLRSTYVKGLLAQINPLTKRVHTTLEQTVTATGRLSSRNPNLQNIPIRTELGREIRACFVAGGEGRVLLSADYSQIELRLLAHFSGVSSLCEAFQQDQDIHQATAAIIFEMEPDKIGPPQRRIAKTVNYAVIYGMGAAALAQQIDVTRAEAEEFIEAYFQRLSGVKQYMDQVVVAAEEQGYVETICGRRRYFPELKSGNPGLRAYARRAAANTPLQGSAAEIIKIAMVNLAEVLTQVSPGTDLLLQVHDELLFEVPREEIVPVAKTVKEIMESAWKLTVPLVVDLKSGPNWRDMTTI